MTQKRATNIIIRLREEGWDGDKIDDFILYIGTHNPTEEEAVRSSKLTESAMK